MAKRSTPTSDALEILHRRVYEGMPRRFKKLEEAGGERRNRPQNPPVAHSSEPHSRPAWQACRYHHAGHLPPGGRGPRRSSPGNSPKDRDRATSASRDPVRPDAAVHVADQTVTTAPP